MKTLKMPKGISDFCTLRNEGYYYVDKSHFVTEVVANSSLIQLIPRPRRFGKTLNMTMLQTWFERLPQGGTHTQLLNTLKAATTAGEHHQRRGKIPVIFFSFKDVKEPTWADTLMQFAVQVTVEVQRLAPWWKEASINPSRRGQLDKLEAGSADRALLSQALRLLSQTLAEVSGELPLLLIDEYDTPVQAGLVGGFFDDVVTFMRNFLSAGLKDNPHIWKGVLTGILRVSKENMFSGLNNLDVCSLTNHKFDTCFGLLEGEVEDLLAQADLSQHLGEARRWYNGYLFGQSTIYNPWSVISFVSDPSEGCQPHWVNTGNTQLLRNAISDSDGILRREIEDLLSGVEVEKPIDDHVTYSKDGIRPNDVWSFLLFTGYLKVNGPLEQRGRQRWGKLSLPNEEVLVAFEDLVTSWASDMLGRSEDVTTMLQAFALGNQDVFERFFRRLVLQVLSFHDVYPETAESFYHAFVTGILVGLGSSHLVRSNRESGIGRYDVMLIPKNIAKYPGLVVEFKIVGKNESPEDTLVAAHAQIIEKKYASELEAQGATRILKWAIAFKGKEVFLSLK